MTPPSAMQWTLRGLTAATVIALVALTFRAYQDPSVFLPLLGAFFMCG